MKPYLLQNGRVLFALAGLCATPRLQAEFIQPVAVLASNGAGTQDTLIDGGGFDDPVGSPQAVHTPDGAQMWSGVGSIRESVIFDLGKAVNLTKVYIWNYNVANATDVGMKDVEVQVSADTNMTNASFNAIAQISLKEGGDTAQTFAVVGTGVRLVKLKGLSNWGQGYTVGLAEVRFESGDITGHVPLIVLNSPHEGDEIRYGTDISLDAKVTDSDLDLDKVEFFDGTTLLTNKAVAPFTFTWKGAAQGAHAVQVRATDKTAKVAWVTANINVRELVADRIVSIDDTADEGADLNQIQYTGAWTLAQGEASDPRYQHNDHYESSNNKNDYFVVRFKGVMIEVYATVASHHGTGLASIDGGPESKVNYKAAQRAEQVFLWRSPILPNREHTLKIRVAGDGVVTADRFDVSVSDKPEATTAVLKEVTATFTNVVAIMEDAPTSVVDPATAKMSLDGSIVSPKVSKTPPLTTITYAPPSPFQPGSNHAVIIEVKDTAGTSITNSQTFTLPAPFFPLTGLGGPASTPGNWGFRQIWNAGRADSVVSAVDIANQATQPGFAGKLQDVAVPSINFALSSSPGAGGLFTDHQPVPAESTGLSTNDFVLIGRAEVKIPRSGDWTIGVHTDDGFALRFIGAPFDSVSGNGTRDDNFPEYMGFLNESGNTDTRGVLKGIAAGEYEIEFVAFQRTGGSMYEVYAAEGAFANDADTDQWQLIGAPGGLEIVAGPKGDVKIKSGTKAGSVVTLEVDSPEPAASHQLDESTDLKAWRANPSATVQSTATGVRITIPNVTGAATFYRIVVHP
jgi:hypothetical protein